MRRKPDGQWRPEDLAYCSNVHPGESLDAVNANLQQHFVAVRELRGLAHMAAGLWLSAKAAAGLTADPAALAEFDARLEVAGCRLRTLNGFPYGDFHGARVKAAVYRPDWSDPRRGEYTLDLARVLSRCCDRPESTISSLPLGDAADWDAGRQALALDRLCETLAGLDRLRQETGHSVRLCLEMEPGCVLERSEQSVELLTRLLPARARLAGLSNDTLQRHIGLCLDVCHQAVMFESLRASLNLLLDAGIAIGKIQVSNAIELPAADNPWNRNELRSFDEPRYLHQTCARYASGRVHAVRDLDQLERLPVAACWRTHFHVPLQSETLRQQSLNTTHAALFELFDALALRPGFRPQLEVETYTWEVLPDDLRPRTADQLHAGIARELDWLQAQLRRRKMLAAGP